MPAELKQELEESAPESLSELLPAIHGGKRTAIRAEKRADKLPA